MKKILYLTLSTFFLLWATILRAEVHIEITQGVNMARPIRITSFKWDGPGVMPEDIGNIIATDLRNSGKFNPIDQYSLSKRLVSITKAKLMSQPTLDVDAVVFGKIQAGSDGRYTISYRLMDTSSNSVEIVLAQNQYKVTKQWIRYAAHTASDEIFEKLTGIKGAFRTRIAYIVRTNDNQYPYELRVSDYDGYNQFLVHRSPKQLMSPAWSPDGNQLAYVTFESGKSALVIQTLDNGLIRQVASFPGHNGAPSFSPDGSKLAFALSKSGSLNIYVMDLSLNQIHQLTHGRFNSTEPTWYPDSQNLAYTSDQSGKPQIFKININGNELQRITWEGKQNQDADISSDGKFMVMVSTNGGAQHIVRQDLHTGDVKQLTDTFLDETPSLAPNGTMLIYSSTEGMTSVLQLVSIDGRSKMSFPVINGKVKSPAWSSYL